MDSAPDISYSRSWNHHIHCYSATLFFSFFTRLRFDELWQIRATLKLCNILQLNDRSLIISSRCRRRFTNVCLDNICGYLVELQSLSPNSALQHTIGNFKSLQAKLEKLHWRRSRCSLREDETQVTSGSSLHALRKKRTDDGFAKFIMPPQFVWLRFCDKRRQRGEFYNLFNCRLQSV